MRKPVRFEELPPPPAGKTDWPWTVDAKSCLPAEPPGGWPKLTVVTPSFNQGEFLEETLRSVLLQGYPNLEFFVFDGGSSDESVEILQRYEPWLDFWVSEKDRGQSHAINKGFERATGDILAWLNSDDVFEAGALALVGARLAGKTKALLVGAAVITDGPDALSGRRDERYPSWPAMLYEARTFPQPSTFWTKDLAQAVSLPTGLLDESLYFVMDYELWLRMRQQANEVIFIPDLLSYERTHAGQKTLNHDERFHRERARAVLRVARMVGEGPTRWMMKSRLRRAWLGCRSARLSYFRPSSLQSAISKAAREGVSEGEALGGPNV